MLSANVHIPDSLKEHLLQLGMVKAGVEIGIFEGATYAQADPDNGASVPVAYVAYLNEYGGPHNPERPFFRRTLEKCEKKWMNGLMKNIEANGFNQPSVLRAFEMLGIVAVGDVKVTIHKWPTDDPRPNNPVTIQRKRARAYDNTAHGGNLKGIDPEAVLIDTGTMVEAIRYEVIK